MKVRLSVQSGVRLPNGFGGRPGGGYVAWAELGGIQVTGVLARHTNRHVVEHLAEAELARRLRRLLAESSSISEADRLRRAEPA